MANTQPNFGNGARNLQAGTVTSLKAKGIKTIYLLKIANEIEICQVQNVFKQTHSEEIT
ncbi:hypothetical protein KIN20_035723 [Parelaphostrongylus tenuis]|uniref:Uncharacterized protein n=1 Tax=Parelaphostrongylus tenuis TaxID=148309 RepID=A0AAD5RBK5_PARTN|nr:hypothetical protein KIN20_035723 [Parelaphostrongylus tenuis]